MSPSTEECAWQSEDWRLVCAPADGARLSRLAWRGRDLLTAAPRAFRPPDRDLGRYETRPVFGYDDCFPTVDPCDYPGRSWTVPDHGECCWLPWEVETRPDGLCCTVASRALPVTFERRLICGPDTLDWRFRLVNQGAAPLPFLHVMHALMPPGEIEQLELPDAAALWDEIAGAPAAAPPQGAAVARALLTAPGGAVHMWILRTVTAGRVTLKLRDGLTLTLTFPADLFPTLGIWWNRRGYPEADDRARDECAFEPLAAPTSSLAAAHAVGQAPVVPPGGEQTWRIHWNLNKQPPTR
ncbi:MAG: hypothetical protein K9N49_07795 [Candidatus Marinimicrobia bacterium]|nr:hypothetical protein [Candidatus Neomarinimicrobiota bacterium]